MYQKVKKFKFEINSRYRSQIFIFDLAIMFLNYTFICISGLKAPNTCEALKICARLGSCRLLITEEFSTSIHQRILLNISTDDLHYALQKIDISAKE